MSFSYEDNVTIEGVKVALTATAVGSGRWTWEFRSPDGLSGSNSEELAPDFKVALDEARDAARAAIRERREQQ